MKFDDICLLYDLETIAESFGFQFHGNASRWSICHLPQHSSGNRVRTPSFSVYTFHGRKRFKCHGQCGLKGDVIDFIGYMTMPGYDPTQFELRKEAASRLSSGSRDICPSKIVPTQEILLPDFIWMDFMPIHEQVAEYLHGRGFTDKEIEKWKFGSATRLDKETGKIVKEKHQGLLSIPTIHFGATRGVKLRILKEDARFRYFSLTGSRGGLFNFDEVYGRTEPVIIAKGELCAALMARHFLACSLTTGESVTRDDRLFKEIRAALALSPKIYVGDNDAPGRKNGPLIAARHDAILKYPPDRYKDWDRWFLAEPDDCLEQTRLWTEEAKGDMFPVVGHTSLSGSYLGA